jgi:hypothetical protein
MPLVWVYISCEEAHCEILAYYGHECWSDHVTQEWREPEPDPVDLDDPEDTEANRH